MSQQRTRSSPDLALAGVLLTYGQPWWSYQRQPPGNEHIQSDVWLSSAEPDWC